jgi:hypothetical protein
MIDLLKTPHQKLLEEAGINPDTPGMLKTPKQFLFEEMGMVPKLAEGGPTARQMEAELMVAGRTPPKFGSIAEIMSNLTPQEQKIAHHHFNTMFGGTTGRDEQGRPVTVYSTGVEMDSGPHKGKFALVPGYVDQQIIDPDTARDYWRTEINKGMWPIYNSSKELNDRSQYIHGIMDQQN